jgi:CBS domain-containing protein
MTADVVCGLDTLTVQDLVHLLRKHQITGVPVLDSEGALVGVVSTTDIILHDEDFGEGPVLSSDYHRQLEVRDNTFWDEFALHDVEHLLVKDIMSTEVWSAGLETPVEELVQIMYDHRIHRILITDNHRIVGIISTMDIFKAVMDQTLS